MDSPGRGSRRAPVLAAGAIAVVGLSLGCGAPGGTKAGKRDGPVVLRMANRDAETDFAGDPAVGDFVRRVGELSGGVLRIQVAPYWGNGQPGAEAQIVRAVAAGKVDLGAVGTRIFDTLGVSSFQALTAPMLIDSYPLERAVIASDIPGQMLDGLGKLKLTGLAVLGEGLRKPVAVSRPLLGPADWRGITFAAFRSRGAATAVRALGARPEFLWGRALADALTAGEVQGAESDLRTYSGQARQEQAPYVTANVNLWPRTEALLANPNRFAHLTSEQQGWLHAAAEAAAKRSTSLSARDGELAVALCKSGARFANASAARLAALRQAFVPIYTYLERDARTKAFVAAIVQLKQSTPSGPTLAIPAGCTDRVRAPTVVHGTVAEQSAVNGIYRVAVSDADFKANGVTGRTITSQNHGLYTWFLHDGRWRVYQRANNPLPFSGNGHFGGLYAVKGHRITFVFAVPGAPPGAPPPTTMRWRAAKGELRFTLVGQSNPALRTLFTTHPWKKIG